MTEIVTSLRSWVWQNNSFRGCSSRARISYVLVRHWGSKVQPGDALDSSSDEKCFNFCRRLDLLPIGNLPKDLVNVCPRIPLGKIPITTTEFWLISDGSARRRNWWLSKTQGSAAMELSWWLTFAFLKTVISLTCYSSSPLWPWLVRKRYFAFSSVLFPAQVMPKAFQREHN